jgi:hypothetical protein
MKLKRLFKLSFLFIFVVVFSLFFEKGKIKIEASSTTYFNVWVEGENGVEDDALYDCRTSVFSLGQVGETTYFYASEQDLFGNNVLHQVTGNVQITLESNGKMKIAGKEGSYLKLYMKYMGNSGELTLYKPGTSQAVLINTNNSDMSAMWISTAGLREGISGQENFVANVDEQKPVTFFQGYLYAFDNYDGDLTSDIYIVTDNYTPNKSVLGTHTVTFGVEDSSGNVSTFAINITVVDVTKPTITGSTAKVQISYTQTWNINAFKSTLVASDNYDTLTNADITIKSDGYTSNKTNLGTYNVVFSLKDSSNNEQTFTKQVEVIDDVAPTFSGQTSYVKNITGILTVNDIKGNLTATDAKDGNRTAYITVKSDGYTGKGHIVGTYTIVFEVKDTKNNTATLNVTVQVMDNIPPVWYVADGTSIVLIPPMQLTRTQIIDLLVKTGQIDVGSTSNVSFFLDEYVGNEDEPGIYNLGFNFSSASGHSSVHNFTITVASVNGDDGGITIEPRSNVGNTLFWIGVGAVIIAIGVVILKRRRY